MQRQIEQLVIRYTRLIHPEDLGKETSELENKLRELVNEVLQEERGRMIRWVSSNYSRSTHPLYAHVDASETIKLIKDN